VQYEVLNIAEPRAYFDRLAATPSALQQQQQQQQVKEEDHLPQSQQQGDLEMLDVHLGVPGQQGITKSLHLLSAVDPNNLPCPPVSSYCAYEVRTRARWCAFMPVGLAQFVHCCVCPLIGAARNAQ